MEFARTKEQLFDRWCSSKKVGSDHEKLRQLMLVEEFKWCINSDVRDFLNENEVENMDLAARLADYYSLTHKASFINKTNSTNLYPPTKGYLRETCKSQNINPIYLSLSSPSVSFTS